MAGAVDLSALKRAPQADGGERAAGVEITEVNFEAEVLTRSSQVPVVVLLWSPRSDVCVQLVEALSGLDLSVPEGTGRSFLSAAGRPTALAANPRRLDRRGLLLAAYSALLPLGFAMPTMLPWSRWALTPPFHPYRRPKTSAVCSLLHCPSGRPDLALASTLPYEAPTFLSTIARAAVTRVTHRHERV